MTPPRLRRRGTARPALRRFIRCRRFASPEAAVKAMKGTCFTFDGDPEAAPVAQKIVDALGGRMVRIAPESRPLYHAASCVLSNYLVAVADLGLIMLELSGMDKAEAARAARPLLRGTVENIEKLGVPAALTGPDLARRRRDRDAPPGRAGPAAAGNPPPLLRAGTLHRPRRAAERHAEIRRGPQPRPAADGPERPMTRSRGFRLSSPEPNGQGLQNGRESRKMDKYSSRKS